MLRKTHRPWLLAIGIVPLALTLTGCFGIPGIPSLPNGSGGGSDDVDDELVENIIEGSGEGLDFEIGSLPADFPVDDVPLVDGDIMAALSISSGKAWTVTIAVADEATAKSAPDLLERAGFSNESTIFWETDDYIVILASEDDDDNGWIVQYQVQVQQ